MLPIRSLRTRIIVFFVLLLLAAQLIAFVAIHTTISENAHKRVREELQVGQRIFLRLLEDRRQQLTAAASILAADFAFRQAVASGDLATTISALNNHGSRIGAATMMLVATDNMVLADTLHADAAPQPFAFPDLVAKAEAEGSASAIALIAGAPYQLVVVPVRAPLPVAWVVVGFRTDDQLARELGLLTNLEVSFASRQPHQGWRLAASTLPPAAAAALVASLPPVLPEQSATLTLELPDEHYEVSTSPLTVAPDTAVIAVLQRSLREAIAPFNALRTTLALLALANLGGTVIGSVLIGRGISRPVTALASFARRIERGEYDQPALVVNRADEFGELASAFNHMREAIAAREREISTLAYQDLLTGLPNRTLFSDRLHQAMVVAKRLGHPASVLLIDLDRFKEVNDTLGHHIGDLLLREVGARLQSALARGSDTVARLGGDEFAVLLPTANAAMAEATARRLLWALEEPIELQSRLLDVAGSIGIASFPEHGEDPNLLLSRADAAMYRAKRKHCGCVSYDARLDAETDADGRLSLMGELRRAIEQNELVLFYQPQLELREGLVCHAEALVRWRHPESGFVLPQQFIPFAEQTGCIREITQWVVGTALRQCARWQEQGLPVTVSINLSVRDLLDYGLPDKFAALLADSGASPESLRLEITESAIMDDPARALETVARLHGMGFKLSIDDFGTGYSSLAYLKKLPVDELKIDRSFVANVATDAEDRTIVRSTIELAHNMGLQVVAEGVENEQVLHALAGMGCDFVQGYEISKPLSAEQFETWVAQRERWLVHVLT